MAIEAELASRIEARLERTGLGAEDVDRLAGLPPGTTLALATGQAGLPRGQAFRRLVATLETTEEFILGLEPGDLIPLEMLEEAQGELGLLAPDEEALLRHYRRLDIATRAAIGLVVARAAGPEPDPPPEPAAARARRKR